jgi:hypothetical protein
MADNKAGAPKGGLVKWRDPERSPNEDDISKRAHERHNLSIMTDIYVGSYCVKSKAFLKDISLKGAGFSSKENIQLNTSILFCVDGLKLSGEVVRSEPDSCGMCSWGINFKGLGFFGKLKLGRMIDRIREKNKLAAGAEDVISETIIKKDGQ